MNNENIFLKYEEIHDIFKNHLKIESTVMSIDTLFASVRRRDKINFAPYYQRNYVWDDNKASYFIESILLGTEIPPLVFFDNGTIIEVIDGRQRFETIKKFIDNDFSLTSGGLSFFKHLAKKRFTDLEIHIQDLVWDTKLRMIEFTIVNEPRLDERREDMIKKEIFRRYNSGITPLRTAEIEKAIYLADNPTSHFKIKFKESRQNYMTVLDLFFSAKDVEWAEKDITLEKVLQKVRFLLIAQEMPIISARNKQTLAKFYEYFTDNIEDIDGLYLAFVKKVDILNAIKLHCIKNEISTTRLVFETLYWGIAILEKEGFSIANILEELNLLDLLDFIKSKINIFQVEESHFYKQFITRYNMVADYLEDRYHVNFSIYISSNSNFRQTLKELSSEEPKDAVFDNLESIRLNKPDASTTSIDDICRQMLRRRFLLRPPYQRGEVINRAKSSAIIESILLGIKLPPIFIYKREDGVSEVIDGQQRILSVIGYIGEEFIDENGKRTKSEKNNFSLSKLTILNELNGKHFHDLPENLREKILDFKMSLVTIDQKLNPDFDPIDLFIRLNNKPFPIKENSFEMWNSYIDKEIIEEIKKNVEEYGDWFYLRKCGIRMENEELYTSLAYLEYKHPVNVNNENDSLKYLDFYHKSTGIIARIKSKNDITKNLATASTNPEARADFLKSIKVTESFIKKLRIILIDQDLEDESAYLREELDNLIDVKDERYFSRKLQDFYLLWFILHGLNQELVIAKRADLKRDLRDLIMFVKTVPAVSEEKTALKQFYDKLNVFQEKYFIDKRRIVLSQTEKEDLIRKQQNKCPICGGPLFIGDDIDVDHKKAISTGGRDAFLNLQITHRFCNRKKATGKKK